MIPILSAGTTLTGQGLGRMTEALSCVITHEINGEYELRMTYPVTGERYADLAQNEILWATPDNVAQMQAFRIYRITRPLNGIVTIYARHIAYDMSGIIVKPCTGSTLANALSAITSACAPASPFTLTTSRTVATAFELKVPTPLWTVLGGAEGSLLDIYGGEWDFDNFTATLATELGSDRGVSVRYGKNLTQLEQDVSIEATYAGVFPYWYDEETDTLVKLTGDYISIAGATGSRIFLLDLSDKWDTAPTQTQLTNATNAYIAAHDMGTPKISWKVNMAMLGQSTEFVAALEQVGLGDTVHVYYEPMNLTATARAVKTEYDVLLERYTEITLGRVKQNLAAIVAANQRDTTQAMKTMKSTLESAISESTDFILNGAGYMRFIYDANEELTEIVSLDNADINLAQSVWRWNNGGFGHSSTGINGPYTLAITQNGAIVADFITAGTMAGNRIRTGLIEDETHSNYWNLDTGELSIQAMNNFGGRNLIINTLEPSVASAADYPKLVGGSNSAVNETASVAPHGIRATVTTGGTRTTIYFSQSTGGLNGLTPGETYTLSYDASYKVLSNLSSGSYVLSTRLYADANGDGNTAVVKTVVIDTITTENAGVEVTGKKISGSVTIPAAATIAYFITTTNVASASSYAANDYLELANIKLERGEVATAWTPAPEDLVGNDEIITKINASPESVTIQASKVNLTGYVTFTNLSTPGQTTIDGGNITTGYIDAGRIDANTIAISQLTGAARSALVTNTAVKNQYYISTSSSSATGGSWADTTAAWSSGKYVWTRVVTTKTFADGTSTTTNGTAVYDANLTTALSTASTALSDAGNAQTTANSANYEEQLIYKSAVTGTTTMSGTTTWVTDDTGAQATWTIRRPEYDQSYPVMFVATQRKTVSGTVTCTTPLIDDTLTVIDGGNIITGTITANKIAANEVFSQAITAQDLTITGGTININTSSDNTSIIQLNSPNVGGTSITSAGFFIDGSNGFALEMTKLYIRAFDNDGALWSISQLGRFRSGGGSAGDGTIQVMDSGDHVRGDYTPSGLTFYDTNNAATASYPATGLRVQDLNCSQGDYYNTAGGTTKTYTLPKNGIYLVCVMRWANTTTSNDSVALVSVRAAGSSHVLPLITGSYSISISNNVLTITTTTQYSYVAITALAVDN